MGPDAVKLIELRPEIQERPELEVMLSGCATDAERKAVREAFHTFAQGDPGAFGVQFSVLLQAHANALKSASERIREERKLIQSAAESMLSISERRIILGLVLAFALGVVSCAVVISIWRLL
jgi:hypothetical protein